MKKILFILLCLLVSFTNVFAAVAIYENGTYKGEATAIDIAAGQGTSTFTNGEKANIPISTNILATGVYNANVTTVTHINIATKTLGSVNYKLMIIPMGTVTRTLTLPNGTAGQTLTILIQNSSAPATVTLTATTKTGWDTATLDSPNDTITLLFIDTTYGWVVVGENGVTITHTVY